jgi:MoaA/NifB/PqqE/SkfB family radical SAM enzyme
MNQSPSIEREQKLFDLSQDHSGRERHASPAETARTCFVAGCYWLEAASGASFRWSRRRFEMILLEQQIQEIVLSVATPHPRRLTLEVNGSFAETVRLSPGSKTIRFRIGHCQTEEPAQYLRFSLDQHWQPHGSEDQRKLGIQLLSLEVVTASQRNLYPVEQWQDNAPRHAWLKCDSFFRSSETSAPDLDRQRRNAELSLKERERPASSLRSTPLKLYLEVAWLCNLHCPSCFHAYIPPQALKEAPHFMSIGLFREIADTLLPGAVLVWFNGNGESLLHPNIETIFQTAQEFPFVPALLTSGSLFTERNMRLLVEGGFFLSVSVDSPRAEDFERLRKGARFSKVVAAIRHMQELKESLKRPRFNLRIQCVAQQSNLHQLAELVEWAAALGIEEVQFLPLHNFGMPYPYLEQAKLQNSPHEANTRMFDALRVGTRLGVRVRPFPPFPQNDAFHSEFQEAVEENLQKPIQADPYYDGMKNLAEHPANRWDRHCQLAWAECFIGVDGTVTPCDMYIEKLAGGNLYDDDFWTIWNSSKMIKLRRTVNGANPTGLCQHGVCMFRPPRQQPPLQTPFRRFLSKMLNR